MQEIQRILAEIVAGENLSSAKMERLMQILFSGGATPAQIAGLLVALRLKGETAEEIAAAAAVMRHKARPFSAPAGAFDTCGTGGDGSGSLNVSTAVAFVLAACGVPVVKHGNRSVSSRSGSADVLEALGVDLQVPPETMQHALEKTGCAFLLAPLYHYGMRHISPVRQELKLRTIFNLLGPLANPAQPDFQLLGVYHPDLLQPMAEALQQLGTKAAWVVCGAGGLDEIALHGETEIIALEHNELHRFTLTPEEAGLTRQPLTALQGGDAAENAAALSRLLAGEAGAYRDAVLLNTAACLIIAGKAQHLEDGVAIAANAIDSGKAREVLDTLMLLTEAQGE
jgi:anthranilate phosphoribosyltransferase